MERFLDETAAVKYRIEDDKRLLLLLLLPLLLDIAVVAERLLEEREEEEEFVENTRPLSIQLLSDPDCIEGFFNDGYLNLNEEGDDDDDDGKENGCTERSAYFPLSSG